MSQLHALNFSRLCCVAPGKYKYDFIDLNIIKCRIRDSCLNCLKPEFFLNLNKLE